MSFLSNNTKKYVFVNVKTMFFTALLMAFTILQKLSIEIAYVIVCFGHVISCVKSLGTNGFKFPASSTAPVIFISLARVLLSLIFPLCFSLRSSRSIILPKKTSAAQPTLFEIT